MGMRKATPNTANGLNGKPDFIAIGFAVPDHWSASVSGTGPGGHNEIVFVQTTDGVSPPAHRHLAPLEQNGGMMPLGFGQFSDPVGKRLSLGKVTKPEDPLQLLFPIQLNELPVRNFPQQTALLIFPDFRGICAAGLAGQPFQ
jgi:hypothetical protein